MAIDLDPTSLDAIGRRLRLLRLAYNMNQRSWAALIEVEPPRWNNYERGRKRIVVDLAMDLRKRFGVPLDWVYAGEESSLSVDLAKRLRAAQDRDEEDEISEVG